MSNGNGKNGKSRTILLSTDGSVPALAATVRAVQIAKERSATLVIVNVQETTPRVNIEEMSEDTALGRPYPGNGVDYAVDLAAASSVPTRTVVREGPVTGVILRVAEEVGAELIVLGTSSLKGMNRFYLGSVAKSVVAQAPVSVEVVKPTPQEVQYAVSLVKQIQEEEPTQKALNVILKKRQFRVGVYLFSIYIVGYAIFTILGSYFRPFFGSLIGGINVGTAMGIVLIIVTIVMAVAFNWYANRAESREA
ncbi:universal stress protein [Methanomassiliicoccus luminyensis]|uniref:universal stress protein n=1 Tax=Methanomassiliicoccus luminyensis TaxID=1080712 RepID=UPI000375EBE2|nr:universal stress protein [Methanomassiliicoccus luminyensis]